MSRRRRNSVSKSSAPQKKAKGKSKGLWWKVLLGVIVLVIAGGVIAYNKVIAFLHSEGFKVQVAEQVSAELGTKGELGDFKWSGLSGKNDSYIAKGDGFIESVTAEDISFDVDMDYIKRDKFTVSDISITNVEAKVDVRKEFEKNELVKRKKGFLEGLLPEEVEIADAKIHDLDTIVLSEIGEFKANGVAIELKKDDDAYRAVLEGGRLNLPFSFLKDAKLKEGQLVQLDNEVYVEDLKLSIFNSGEVLLNGDLDLSPRTNKLYDIDGELTGLKISDVFPKSWRQYLTGDVKGKFNLTPESDMEPKIKGSIAVSDGQLRGLPVLDTFVKYFSTDYRTVDFQKFECNYTKTGDEYVIKDIKLISEGLMQVEGDLTIDNEYINGVIHLGVPSKHLSKLPGSRDNVFKRGKDGLYWARIKLSGSFGNITNDLKDRLVKAAIDAGIEDLFKLGEGVVDLETAEKVLNLAVENGVGVEDLPNLLNSEDGVVKGGSEALKGLLQGVLNSGTSGQKELPGGDLIPNLLSAGGDSNDKDEGSKKDDDSEGLGIPGTEILPLPIPELPKELGIPLPF